MSFSAYPSYPALDLGLDSKDNDTYLSQLSSFLSGNSTAFGGALSSPELTSSSNGSSPESSGGASTAPPSAPAPSAAKSAAAKSVKGAAAAGADKRKQDDNNKTTAHKDRRASGGEAGAPGHTHDQVGSEEDDGEGGATKGKTSERRRQQNRQAQRAFRERKEKHLKELEDRVFSLEQQSQEQSTENSALKQLLERLQSENERLKVFETAFSFTYQDAKNMPQSSQFKPPTPPTAQDEVEDLSTFNGAFNFGPSPPASNSSYIPSTSSVPSLFGSLSNSPITSFPTSNPAIPAGASPSGLDTAAFLKQFSVPSPASTTGADSVASTSSLSAANTTVTTPPDDLFSAYRDPTNNFGAPSLTSLSDLDSLFGMPAAPAAAGPSPTGLDDFSAFLNSPSPPVAPATISPSLASVAGVSPGASCPYGLTDKDKAAFLKRTSEPFQFDLDNLCSDLKAKAVCQEAARAALAAAMAEDQGHTSSLESGFPKTT